MSTPRVGHLDRVGAIDVRWLLTLLLVLVLALGAGFLVGLWLGG